MQSPSVSWLLAIFFGILGAIPALGQNSLESFPKIDASRDWPWWRGANRDGHAADQDLPTTLDEATNLDWSQPIPGRGHSSPVVVGDRVFLLTADEDKETQSALALDRDRGQIIWQVELNSGGFPATIHAKNTKASPTVACDGEYVFATLYHHDAIWLYALSLDGKKVWEKNLGPFSPKLFRHGYAASPVPYGDTVIVAYEYDGPSAIVALGRKDGKEIWRTRRANMLSYSSPAILTHGGEDFMVISGNNQVAAYNPADGSERWKAKGTALATCGTAVWNDGIVLASGGYPASETVGIDLKSGEVLWRNKYKAYEQSMLATEGYVYCFAEGGIMFCWDAKTGEERWKERLTSPNSPSGVLVGDTIYWPDEAGLLYVFKASPDKYTEISKTKLGDEAFASPAICGGQIFLRIAKYGEGDQRQEYLLRFSKR